MMERFIIFCALLVAVYSGPIQQYSIQGESQCSRTCIASDKLNYVPGKTYEFHYDTEVQTSVEGSSENHAGVHMSATVHMEILTKCELVMRLADVSLEEYDPIDLVMKKQNSPIFSEELEKYPLRISFQDGNIEELCLVAEEPKWVMNIKRGILSVFQNNFIDGQENSTLTETDIAGNCATDYTTSDGWYSKTVKKSKNLLSCTERNGYNTVIQGVPYTAHSGVQSLPIIKSTHECEHQIDKQLHHLTSATCHEEHMFRPFSRSDSGAVTHSTQKLKLIQQTWGTQAAVPVLKTASMKFEHDKDEDKVTMTRKELIRKLLEICEETKAGVSSDTPRLFSDLVYLVRLVDYRTLSEAYNRIQNGAVCSDNKERISKFLLDALPVAGTSASLQMMTDLLTRKVVTGLEASMWLTSLAFIKNPTQDMLSMVKPLISMTDNEEKALLSVGSLIHSFCTSHGGCDRNPVVKKMVAAIESKIPKGCRINNHGFESTLIALRAIGNAGFSYDAVPTLIACMKLTSNPIEIRLSALEAFRRMPCDTDQVQIMSVYLDTNEDAEIRIAAYKALMECPNEAVINRVKRTLESEEINQVGSYVWSHLTNLMETSDRHKQYVRDILNDEQLKKEFDLDKRKFSRNYEGSFFVEKLNTGAMVEGDLIWSQKSFIPRSAMLNLTVDLFGHSVNLLELGGRAEGLEYFMETFFGPNGYFSEQTANDAPVDISKSKTLHPAKMKKLDSRYKPKLDQLKAAMYMRVFGNELRYMNIDGLETLLSGPDINILEVLRKLSKNNDYTMTHSMMFLDSSMIIPMGSGFPMNLTVNGTATVDLRLKGKMDLRNFPTLDIDGMIQPSAAIDISSMMSVDAHVTKSGIKMVSTMNTNTAVLGKLKVGNDGVISAEYEMPQPRMDIISVKSSFFTIHNNLEKEQNMITENQQKKSVCSSNKFVTVTGLELCAELQYPNASLKSDAPYFPMTGPVTAGVFLYKRDTHKKYKMEARSIFTPKSTILHFSFDTPESKITRHVSMNINLDKTAHTVDMTLTSPWKKATFQGALTLDRFLKTISGKMNIDGGKPYAINAQMKKERVRNAHKYSPSLEITLPNKEPYTMSGMFKYDGIRQFDIEFNMDKITQKPVKVSGTLYNKPSLMGLKGNLVLGEKDEYSVDISNSIKPYKQKTLYKPFVSIRTPTKELLAFGGTAQYIYGKKMAYNFVLDKIVAKKTTLKGFLQRLVRKKNRVFYRSRVNFASTPMDLSLDAKLDNRNYRTVATDIDFTYVIRRVARNNIKLVSKVNNLSSRALLKGKSNLIFTVKRNPELNVKMIGNVDHNAKHTEANLDVQYGGDFKDANKHLEFAMESNRNIKSLTDVSADGQMRLRHLGRGLNMMLKGNHKHDNTDLDSSLFMRFGKGDPIETTLQLSDKTTELLDVTGMFTLNYPGRQIVINETIRQPEQDKYISLFNGQLQRGEKNSVVTSFTRTSSNGGRLEADISMHKDKPYHVDAEWNSNPNRITTSASYQKGVKRYSGLLMLKSLPNMYGLETDIQLPTRDIKLELGLQPKSKLWSATAKLNWDANRDNTQEVIVSGWLEPVHTLKRINGSVSLTYPKRTLTFNAHNIIGTKISSHADFSWEKNKQVDVDFVYGTGTKGRNMQIISKAKLTTPFDKFKMVSVDLTHSDNFEEYKTNLDLKWLPHSILTTTAIRKPLSFRTILGSIEAQTSFKQARKLKLDINHKLSDSLASAAKLSWNKMFVQAEVVLSNETKQNQMAYKGNINLKTSFPVMKKGTITLYHSNDGMTFVTNADFLRNRKKYGLTSQVTHQARDTGIDNAGTITLFCPYGNSETNWSHRNSRSDIATVFSTKWGNGKKLSKEILFKTHGNMNIEKYAGSVNGSIELLTPFSPINDIQIQLNHVHDGMDRWSRHAFIDSSLKVLTDKREIASVEALRKAGSRELTSYVIFRVPDLEIDSSITISAKEPPRSEKEDAFISFDVVISPSISVGLLLKAMVDDALHSAVVFKSSFPGYQFKYTYDVVIDKFNGESQLSVVRQLHYGNGKIIEIETKLVFDAEIKRGFIAIRTPYDSLHKFEGNILVTGDRHLKAFSWDSYVEVLPYFEKISQSLMWNKTQGLQSSFRVDTPFTELSNLEVNVNYDDSSHVKQATFGLDYSSDTLPYYPVYAEISNDLSDKLVYDMSAKMSAPVTVELTHRGNSGDFKSKGVFGLESGKHDYGLHVGFSTHSKIEGSMTLSLPSRRDITGYFLHSGSSSHFSTHVELLHNRTNQFLSDFSFNSDGDLSVTGSSSIRSDILLSAEQYELEFHHEGWRKNFKSHAEFATTGLGKSEVDLSLDMRTDIDGSISLKSSLTKDIFSSIYLNTKDDYFQARADYTYDGQKLVDFLASIDTLDLFNGEVSLTNPYTRYVKALVRVNGQLENFRSHAELLLDSDLSEVDTSFSFSQKLQDSLPNIMSQAKLRYAGKDQFMIMTSLSTEGKFSGSISVETPFKEIENLKLLVSHEGQEQNFRCHGEFIVNEDRTEADIFFSSLKRYEGLASLKSHLFQDLSVGFEHSGTHTNFKSHGEYTVGFVKTEGDISVDIGNEIDVSVRLRSPDIDEIRFTYNHRGIIDDFTCHAVYTHGLSKREMTLKFKTGDKPKVDFMISAPELSLNLNHAGHVKNFQTNGDVTFGGEKRTADISLLLSDKLEGSVAITAPMFSFKMNQNGNLMNFASNIEVVKDYNRYAAEAHLNTSNGIEANIQLNSPFDGYENLKALYKHEGSFKLMNFKCHGEVSMEDSLSIGDLVLNLETAFEGSVSLLSPGIPDINVEFDHSRTETLYRSHTEVSFDHDVLAGVTVSLDQSSGLEGEIHLQTPFIGYRNIRSSVRYSGNKRSFSLHKEMLLGTDRHEVDVTYDSNPKNVGSLSIRTPLLPELDADFTFIGKPSMFEAKSKLTVDGIKKVGLSGKVNIKDGVNVDFEIDTPIENLNRIEGQLIQIGDMMNMQHDAHVSIDGNTVIKTNGLFSNSDKISASGSVSLNEITLSADFDGKQENFRTHGEFKNKIDIWAADVGFTNDRDLDAFFSLTLPDQDTISGKLTHSIKNKKITTHADLQLDSSNKYELDSSLNWRKAAEATIKIKTPVEGYEDNTLTISHDGQFPNIKSSAKIIYPSNEISLSTDLNHADSTAGKIKIVLPVEGWQPVDISFFSEGSQPNIKAGLKIDYTTGKEIEISVEHDQLGTMEIYKVHLMSPFTDKVDLSFNHTGGLSYNFENSFELSVGEDYRFNIDNRLKTQSGYISYLYTNKALMSGSTYTEKISFNHHGSIENFRTDAEVSMMDRFVQFETAFQLKPVIDGSISLQSSFEAIKDMKAKFSHNGNQDGFVTTGEVHYSPTERIEGKVDFTHQGWRRMVTDIELSTPFKGYSFNKIYYAHKGHPDSFECDGEIKVGEQKITGTVTGSRSPLSLAINIHTPFDGYEKLTFNGNVDIDGRGRYSSRVETSWNPSDLIVVDGSVSVLKQNQLIDGSLSVSSPFEKLRRLTVELTHRAMSEKYLETLKVSYNGNDLVDIELDDSLLQPHKTAALTVRSPRPMKFEVEGEFSLDHINVELTANWNNKDPSSNIHIVAGYDFRPRISDKSVNFKLTHHDQIILYSGSLDLNDRHSKSNLAWGENSDQKIGYDVTLSKSDTRVKLILPTRSIAVTGSNRGRITEGSVMWDADNDYTKKVGFRSVIVPSPDSVKVDLTLMLPSLGKNVQVDSEMVMNRGRIIFDAKTELSYSSDSRKKLVLMSKLEDISSWGTKNYSFSVGLSHPYSTVGIRMDSHIGKSDRELTGSLGLEYLTARRQTKSIYVSGQIHKLKKTVSFELVSPLKTIHISGSAQTNDKFRVSLLNVYDQRQPLNTVFTVDSDKKTVSLTMNYDLDIPSNELHLSAGYVNSSALAAEVSHLSRGVKVTDALLAVRLNSSQLLHNRVHWRPGLMDDLQKYITRKSSSYKQGLRKALETVTTEVDRETVHKLPLMYESLEDLIGEPAMEKINEVLTPVVMTTLEGFNDVTADVIRTLGDNVRDIANRTSVAYQVVDPAGKLRGAYNGLSNLDVLKYARVLRLANQPLSSQAGYAVDLLKDKVKTVPSLVGSALKYSANGMLPDTITQHVTNANQYWELEDHMVSLTDTLLHWLETEAIHVDQLRSLEHNILKTTTAPDLIYDPAHGEIQLDLHLPVPLQTLDSLPKVPEMNSFVLARNVQKLVNNVPVLGQLSSYVPDLSGELVPPFSAHAYIQNGHRITTFDGYDYDLPLDCTFVLVKDFMDGNFSLILSNDGETSLTILSNGKQLNIKLSGEVMINGKQVDLPYYQNNLAVTSPEEGLITVDGASSYKVTWDTAMDHIIVTLSGWYHGRTGGLLGVYDNEPSNDLMTPFRKVINNPKRFALTWDVGRTSCR